MIMRKSQTKGRSVAVKSIPAVTDFTSKAQRLTLDLQNSVVIADIDYQPLSGERGVYAGVRVTGLHRSKGGSWYLSGHMVGKGYRTFKVERIEGFILR